MFTDKKLISVLLFSILFSPLVGCGLLDINKQTEIIEAAGSIKGSVVNKSNRHGPIIVAILKKENNFLKNIVKLKVSEDGTFKVVVLPNDYVVAAYIDNNSNNKYDAGEAGKFYGDFSVVTIAPNQNLKLSTLVITGPPKELPTDLKFVSAKNKIMLNIGKVTSLDDPTFNKDNYSLGMWKPLDFVENVGGGLFLLAPYDEAKTPILFIHGIGGGPTDFSDLIAALDKKRFQPMLLYYPSGLRLDMISDYLSKAVSDLQGQYRFKKMIVVAHSMGGLVSRSFLIKYFKRYPSYAKSIQLYMTINSPMLGIGSLSAIDYYPVVIPVWKDLAPQSPFIKDLHQWRMPESVKYHMVFSYLKGKDSDGVISIYSQLPYNLQTEAFRIHGFNTNHIGPLHDKKPLAVLKSIIEHSNGRE